MKTLGKIKAKICRNVPMVDCYEKQSSVLLLLDVAYFGVTYPNWQHLLIERKMKPLVIEADRLK